MKIESLWQALSPLFLPLGWGWGLFMRLRRSLYRRGLLGAYRPRAKVVSVGNLTLGGEGKTPLVVWLAHYFRREGRSVAIVTRGYGGKLKGPVVASRGEGPLFSPEKIGDEAFLLGLKAHVPLLIAKDRVAGIVYAQKEFATEVIILDDGFQHLRVERDLDLVLVAADQDLQQEKVFPAGRLREPLSALFQAQAFLITKTNLVREHPRLYPFLKGFSKPIFRLPYAMGPPYPLESLFSGRGSPAAPLTRQDERGQRPNKDAQEVVAFCGLGRAEGFFSGLRKLGCRLLAEVAFGDHHHYTPKDIKFLVSLRQKYAAPLVTTEKDAVKLRPFVRELVPCYVFPLDPLPGVDFAKFVENSLEISSSG